MHCDDLEGWDGGSREAQEVGDICLLMADSRFCTAETIPQLLILQLEYKQLYSNLKNKNNNKTQLQSYVQIQQEWVHRGPQNVFRDHSQFREYSQKHNS